MNVTKCGAMPSRRPPAEWFSGSVWQDPVVEAPAPARLRAVMVRFDPGGRTNWHTHPLGQTLFVVAGAGLVQAEGGPLRVIQAGDSVWIPPGEKHWHGASPTTGMTHLAMQEALDGASVNWLEPVADTDYMAAPSL